MKKKLSDEIEKGRVRLGRMASDESYGTDGMFHVLGPCGRVLRIISGTGLGWEHVSVSLEKHTPNWAEMCYVKALFWDEEEAVVQFHPPRSQYVNYHPHCLHLWKPTDAVLPSPPPDLVGPRDTAAALVKLKDAMAMAIPDDLTEKADGAQP